MAEQTVMVGTVDPGGRWLYRVGGISALVLAAGYIVTIPSCCSGASRWTLRLARVSARAQTGGD